MDLIINTVLAIPSKELQWRFSRASGPGGQCVNKAESRVELVFNINQSSVMSSLLKQSLLKSLKARWVNDCLHIVVSETRSQYQNRQLALARLRELLLEGLKEPQKKGR